VKQILFVKEAQEMPPVHTQLLLRHQCTVFCIIFYSS